ncbi:hypothetical protein M011DRAFT_387572, partial [Sporormia fimetaria CBS 119925]
DIPSIPQPDNSHTTLPIKPNARIAYTYYPPSIPPSPHHPNPFSTTLIVFLNDALHPRTAWTPTIRALLHTRIPSSLPTPALLTYDRYGQGDSDSDPEDKTSPTQTHTPDSAIRALHALISKLWPEKQYHQNRRTSMTSLHTPGPTHSPRRAPPPDLPQLILVASSLGVPLARLFTTTYPGLVSGLLFLDSALTDTDYVSCFPDPDSPSFNPHLLPPGITTSDLRTARSNWRANFHPDMPTPERLDRSSLRTLLPSPSEPKLHEKGYMGLPPYVTVVGHDWQSFATRSKPPFTPTPSTPAVSINLHTKKPLTMLFLNPVWRRYNEGLVRLTSEERGIGVVTAVACGHFVHVDDGAWVAGEVGALLDRVCNGDVQV